MYKCNDEIAYLLMALTFKRMTDDDLAEIIIKIDSFTNMDEDNRNAAVVMAKFLHKMYNEE